MKELYYRGKELAISAKRKLWQYMVEEESVKQSLF